MFYCGQFSTVLGPSDACRSLEAPEPKGPKLRLAHKCQCAGPWEI